MFDELLQEKQQVENVNKTRRPKMWHVVMYNDNITPIDYVIMILIEVFNYDIVSSLSKTHEIHKGVSSIIGTYDRKTAEDYCDKVSDFNRQYGFSLLVTIEQVAGDNQ